jgi:hypothetical protein
MSLHRCIAVFGIGLGFSVSALACSCVPSLPLANLVADSRHVFIARVLTSRLSSDGGWIEATFEVEEAFKGEPRSVPSIRARFSEGDYALPGRSSCPELHLTPGMHFLVFAADESPAIYALCRPTQPLRKRDDPIVPLIRSITRAR